MTKKNRKQRKKFKKNLKKTENSQNELQIQPSIQPSIQPFSPTFSPTLKSNFNFKLKKPDKKKKLKFIYRSNAFHLTQRVLKNNPLKFNLF